MDVTEEKKKNMLDHAQALSMSSKTLYSKALKKEKNRKKQSMRVPLHLFLGTFFFFIALFTQTKAQKPLQRKRDS